MLNTKKQRIEYRDRLVQLANDLGYDVELDSPMKEIKEAWDSQLREALNADKITQDDFNKYINNECRPAGDCNYIHRRIRVREGKGLSGQVATLVHELCHALGLGGESILTFAGSTYCELACESVTEFVCTALGIDRTAKTSQRIMNYGFGAYLLTPVTATYTRIILENIGIDPTTWEPSNVGID